MTIHILEISNIITLQCLTILNNKQLLEQAIIMKQDDEVELEQIKFLKVWNGVVHKWPHGLKGEGGFSDYGISTCIDTIETIDVGEENDLKKLCNLWKEVPKG